MATVHPIRSHAYCPNHRAKAKFLRLPIPAPRTCLTQRYFHPNSHDGTPDAAQLAAAAEFETTNALAIFVGSDEATWVDRDTIVADLGGPRHHRGDQVRRR